ncbi:hypothetical protein B0H14DRAFT_3439364 [Mycena olivaceomarginata]|nr:hypothetical protein B0H14DRAFT_3439364 [Mycena olivaceomarginata]
MLLKFSAIVPLVSMLSIYAAPALQYHNLPLVNDRFKKLLTDSSGNLLTGDALRQLTGTRPIRRPSRSSSPAGLNIPHLHPRANEMFTVIDGILDTGFVQENGFQHRDPDTAREVPGNRVSHGSIHYQQNPTCSPAVFVASLNSEDPGRSDIATSFWMLPSDVVDAALGFPETIGASTIDAWRAHLPVNLAAGVDSCLKSCGLSH